MILGVMDGDITSRLLADATMMDGDLGSRIWTDGTSGLCDDIMEQDHHIWVMTDITIRMVTLAAQH